VNRVPAIGAGRPDCTISPDNTEVRWALRLRLGRCHGFQVFNMDGTGRNPYFFPWATIHVPRRSSQTRPAAGALAGWQVRELGRWA